MDVWSVFGWVVAATPICLLWGLALTDIHGREDLRGVRAAAWALVVLVPLVGAPGQHVFPAGPLVPRVGARETA